MRRCTALVVALVALLGGAACGGGTVPAGAAHSPSASPSAPKGGPVPVELAGAWTQVADPTIGLKMTGTSFAIGHPDTQAHGNVAVNGSEIDFYNSDACFIPLPGGIGTYRWTISAGLLTFGPLNADPCSRGPYLADPKGWQRPP